MKNKGEYQFYLANVDVRWGEFNLQNLSKMRFEDYEQERYGLEYGDLVICEGGEPGRCAIWKNQIPNMKIQKALHRVRTHSCLNNVFLYYWFLLAGKNGLLEQYFTGSTIKHMPSQKLKEVVIDLPPIDIQNRIAFTLSAYDDLIENKQKQIKLLEEAAQRLYKEWFVDLRFPGHENVEFVDGLPRGWEEKRLDEIAYIIMGQSPKSEFYNNEFDGLPFHQGVGTYGNRYVKDDIYSSVQTKVAEAGSILFSVRAPVGRLNITKNKIIIGRGLSTMNHKQGYQSYLFYLLKERFFKEDLMGNGSVYASISKDELCSIKFCVPNEELVKRFNNIVCEIDRKILVIDEQISKLQEARDRLLPKLMSGEVEV